MLLVGVELRAKLTRHVYNDEFNLLVVYQRLEVLDLVYKGVIEVKQHKEDVFVAGVLLSFR